MNLILHLEPELEAELRRQAAATGKDPETLAVEALEDSLSSGSEPGELLSKDLRLSRFRALIASMADGNPDADLSREAAYGDRG